MDQAELHNRVAGEIVSAIIKPIVESQGTIGHIMLLTESVVFGVTLACVRFGADEKILDLMMKNIKHRLAEARLGDIQTFGEA